MSRLRAYLAELRTPTAYVGFAGTKSQFGHQGWGLVAVGPLMALGLDGLSLYGAALVVVPMIYFLAWERGKIKRPGQTADALVDTAFVALGGFFVAAFGLWCGLPMIAAAGLFGIWTARA